MFINSAYEECGLMAMKTILLDFKRCVLFVEGTYQLSGGYNRLVTLVICF